MKHFLFELLIFFSLLFLVDRLTGYMLGTFRPTDYKEFLASKTSFFNNPQDPDVLIIGDSHINDAFDTRTLESQTVLNGYNLGVYGASPLVIYYTLKAALKHVDKQPKILIVGTNPIMFERELTKGNYASLFLPLQEKIELNYSVKQGFGVDFFSRIFREKHLVGKVKNMIFGNPYTPTRIIEDTYQGHLKFFNQQPKVDWNQSKKQASEKPIQEEQVNYFEKTIELAQKSGVVVVLVHSPHWRDEMEHLKESVSFKRYKQKIDEILVKYKLREYPKQSELLNNSLLFSQDEFLNTEHLNYKGSRKFTEMLILDLGL